LGRSQSALCGSASHRQLSVGLPRRPSSLRSAAFCIQQNPNSATPTCTTRATAKVVSRLPRAPSLRALSSSTRRGLEEVDLEAEDSEQLEKRLAGRSEVFACVAAAADLDEEEEGEAVEVAERRLSKAREAEQSRLEVETNILEASVKASKIKMPGKVLQVGDARVGFIGCGSMATALMVGFASKEIVVHDRMCGSCKSQGTVDRMTKLGIQAFTENAAVVSQSDVIFLSVKPYVLPTVLQEIAAHVTEDKLLVSVAAGVTLATMEKALPPNSRVVRVMPNTPCSVGAAASAYVKGTHATEEDMVLVGELLNSVGVALPCLEKDLNAVTGLSGSGPAYVFLMMEAMADGGVRAGLPRNVALKLAIQTLKGAAMMAEESGLHPGVLKDQVCSPGGTTISGVEALERGNFRATVMNAVTSAKNRADELSKE